MKTPPAGQQGFPQPASTYPQHRSSSTSNRSSNSTIINIPILHPYITAVRVVVQANLLLFFPIPFYCLRPSFSLPPSRNSDPGSHHVAGSSPPSPLRSMPCIFIARRFQLFPPSSTCVELCLPTLGILSNCCCCCCFFCK